MGSGGPHAPEGGGDREISFPAQITDDESLFFCCQPSLRRIILYTV